MLTNNKTTSMPELTAILLVRLGFLWLLTFVSFLMPKDAAAFYTFMGIAFIITVPYSLWLRNKLRTTQFAPLQFLVDLMLVTGLVYYTGGVHSSLTLLYPLVILSAGIVATPKQAAEITLLAIITYTLMATLLSTDVLIEFMPSEAALKMQTSNSAVVLRGFMFALFGITSVYVAKRCNFSNARENDLALTTTTILSNIPAPALLLNQDGTILFVNKPACLILNTPEELLCGSRFADLCITDGDSIPEKHGQSAYLTRKKGKPVPVSYQTSAFPVPESALGSSSSENTEITVTLITFTNIADALENERQLRKVERITAATRIAGEMAHEIRTPLTAISASVQLLKKYEEKATSADWLPNSPRRVDRKELFEHIQDASVRMDEVVQNFIDFAEFSPADLLSIIKLDSTKENQGYIDHLNTLGRSIKNGQNTDSGRRSDDSELVE